MMRSGLCRAGKEGTLSFLMKKLFLAVFASIFVSYPVGNCASLDKEVPGHGIMRRGNPF